MLGVKSTMHRKHGSMQKVDVDFGKVSVGVVKGKQVETVAIFSPSHEAVALMEGLLQSQSRHCVERDDQYNRT